MTNPCQLSLIDYEAPSEELEAIAGIDEGYVKILDLPAGQTIAAACAIAIPEAQASGEGMGGKGEF